MVEDQIYNNPQQLQNCNFDICHINARINGMQFLKARKHDL